VSVIYSLKSASYEIISQSVGGWLASQTSRQVGKVSPLARSGWLCMSTGDLAVWDQFLAKTLRRSLLWTARSEGFVQTRLSGVTASLGTCADCLGLRAVAIATLSLTNLLRKIGFVAWRSLLRWKERSPRQGRKRSLHESLAPWRNRANLFAVVPVSPFPRGVGRLRVRDPVP
jgi:hypothetical protein